MFTVFFGILTIVFIVLAAAYAPIILYCPNYLIEEYRHRKKKEFLIGTGLILSSLAFIISIVLQALP